jgi:hypothetical protein
MYITFDHRFSLCKCITTDYNLLRVLYHITFIILSVRAPFGAPPRHVTFGLSENSISSWQAAAQVAKGIFAFRLGRTPPCPGWRRLLFPFVSALGRSPSRRPPAAGRDRDLLLVLWPIAVACSRTCEVLSSGSGWCCLLILCGVTGLGRDAAYGLVDDSV